MTKKRSFYKHRDGFLVGVRYDGSFFNSDRRMMNMKAAAKTIEVLNLNVVKVHTQLVDRSKQALKSVVDFVNNGHLNGVQIVEEKENDLIVDFIGMKFICRAKYDSSHFYIQHGICAQENDKQHILILEENRYDEFGNITGNAKSNDPSFNFLMFIITIVEKIRNSEEIRFPFTKRDLDLIKSNSK